MPEMREIKERYIVDAKGTKVGVLLDWEDYQWLLEALEELGELKERAFEGEEKPTEVPLVSKGGVLVVRSTALENLRDWERKFRNLRVMKAMGGEES